MIRFFKSVEQSCRDSINNYASGIVKSLQFMQKVATEKKHTTKNKFDFNDLDNRIWVQDGYLCFDCQNFYFAAKISDKEVTLYAQNRNHECEKSLPQLLKSEYNLVDYFYVVGFEYVAVGDSYVAKLIDEVVDGKITNDELKQRIQRIGSKSGDKEWRVGRHASVLNLQTLETMMFYIACAVAVYENLCGVVCDERKNTYEYNKKRAFRDYSQIFGGNNLFLYHDHCFNTIGNGYEWVDGNLVDDTHIYDESVEKFECVLDYKLSHIYTGIGSDYCKLINYPADIKPEWQTARVNMIRALEDAVELAKTDEKYHKELYCYSLTEERLIEYIKTAKEAKPFTKQSNDE